MAYVSTAINFIKDFYLKAAGWIDNHPHKTLWLVLAVFVVLLVL